MLDGVLLLSTTAFFVAGGLVGARLLRLALRTRELTDFIIGFALFDLSAIAYPPMQLAFMPPAAYRRWIARVSAA